MEFSIDYNYFLSKINKNGEKIRLPGKFITKIQFNIKSSDCLNLENQFIQQVLTKSFNIDYTSPLISRILDKFIDLNGPIINIYFLRNHHSLIELSKFNIPEKVKSFFPNQLATFLIDSSENFDNSDFRCVSLIYKLGFIFGICRFIDLSIKESLAITLSILDKKTALELKNFLGTYHNLDHDNSLSYCLSMIDDFELISLVNHKQVVLLAKQMNVSLPYCRDKFRKASSLMDIKLRREECLKIIINFKKSIELNNIKSILNKLKLDSKYSQFNLRLVVGRESRAFGNQAYLFANSKFIYFNENLVKKVNSIENLLKINNLAGLNIENYMFEFRPSMSRLKYLVASKYFPFTQIASGITNLRECLDIFNRKVKNQLNNDQKLWIEKTTVFSIELIELNLNRNADQYKSDAFAQLDNLNAKLVHEINELEKLAYELNSSSGGSKRAAFSVLLQRPSFTGSDRFKLNELETKPEQEESLQRLVHLGGDHLYMSPCYDWIAEASDLIEAVPLFIYERVVLVDNRPETIFEVDQEGLELTIRQIADYWAENIEKTMHSEHVSLARSILIKLEANPNKIFNEIMQQVDDRQIGELLTFDYLILNKIESKQSIETKISKLAYQLELLYKKNIQKCEQIVEQSWSKQNFIFRKQSLEIYLNQCNLINLELIEKSKDLSIQDRFRDVCLDKERDMPAFHLLTTEAPGLIEGFITIVLEEEMAMRNLIKHYNLESQCDQFDKKINKNLFILSDKIIKEFDYESKVNQYCSMGISYDNSVLKVMNENLPVQYQVSSLAILTEIYNLENLNKSNFALIDLDKNLVAKIEDYWLSQVSLDLDLVKCEATDLVYERNRYEPDFCGIQNLHSNLTYSNELNAEIKWLIRDKCLKFVVEKYPLLCLVERRTKFVREHTSLLKSTCRRLVISINGLSNELNNPLFNYTNGFSDGMKSMGLKKRYHSIYAPSRVNLGKDERKSVEIWSQFLGVTDPLAAKHALHCYELINYCPVVRNIREAENLKVSENQWTALIRSCRNVQAFFVERLGIGDIEDLSYHFNQRGGLFFGSLKEAEGYNSGPTAGYCIPKDLLFKLFVGALQDSRKLGQLGIPKAIHSNLIQLMINIYDKKSCFDSIQEWEIWASQTFLNDNSYLSKMFDQHSAKIRDYFGHFFQCYQSKLVFNFSKLIQIIGDTGIPNPLLNNERDLHSVLWSNWSDHKVTLGGEQVNRSTVFTMTRDILESARKSQKLNPNVPIATEEHLRYFYFNKTINY